MHERLHPCASRFCTSVCHNAACVTLFPCAAGFDVEQSLQSLKPHWVSRASADQRKHAAQGSNPSLACRTGLQPRPSRQGPTHSLLLTRVSLALDRGRAGRTGPGVCFRLYSQAEYDVLDAFTPPALLRTPLEAVALLLLKLGAAIVSMASGVCSSVPGHEGGAGGVPGHSVGRA